LCGELAGGTAFRAERINPSHVAFFGRSLQQLKSGEFLIS
jgi:hypothetical protein